MAYGLRTDAFGNMFEGSQRLFEIADKFQEFTTICPCCGRKAIFNMRLDEDGKPTFTGAQEHPGNNYLPVCRKYYKELKEQYGQ
jgi:thymidine kinase